jgi:hypothetical protein
MRIAGPVQVVTSGNSIWLWISEAVNREATQAPIPRERKRCCTCPERADFSLLERHEINEIAYFQ